MSILIKNNYIDDAKDSKSQNDVKVVATTTIQARESRKERMNPFIAFVTVARLLVLSLLLAILVDSRHRVDQPPIAAVNVANLTQT